MGKTNFLVPLRGSHKGDSVEVTSFVGEPSVWQGRVAEDAISESNSDILAVRSRLGMPLCRPRRISSKACDDRRRMYSEVLIGKVLKILSLVGYFHRAALAYLLTTNY